MAEMLRTTSLANMEKLLSAGEQGQKRLIPFGIEREVVIMKLIEHPNIISLYDVWENRGELYVSILGRVHYHSPTNPHTGISF